MLLATLLLAGRLLAAAARPLQTAPADTTRTFAGLLGQPFAWGTLVLRDGRRLQGYLPTGASTLEGVLPYYPLAPNAQPRTRPRLLALAKVRAMRVKSQQYEVLSTGPGGPLLAARRQTGAAELFVLEQRTMAPSFLGAAPVMGLPASGPTSTSTVVQQWYLRRSPEATPLLLTPATFATQLSLLLADDPDLAAQVAARAPGYNFPDLEAIISRYNQRAAARKQP